MINIDNFAITIKYNQLKIAIIIYLFNGIRIHSAVKAKSFDYLRCF